MTLSRDFFMEEAISLAKHARGLTAPNPMVGAVVVDDTGHIWGRGFHPKAGEPHAEVFAIKEAVASHAPIGHCTLFVTLEPCNHFGKTPPCVDLILESNIKNVVVGCLDPNPVMQGKSIEKLRASGVTVTVGSSVEQSEKLIRGFKSVMESRRPFITLKCATSLDGKMATKTGESKWITGPEARARARRERAEHDSILVGVGTILADDPELTARTGEEVTGLKKVILDSRLRTPVSARCLKTAGSVLIYCDSHFSMDRKIALEQAGATVVPVAGKNSISRLDLSWILRDLALRGTQDLLVEGGARVLGSFVSERLFDRMVYFLAPKILGSKGQSVFEDFDIEKLSESVELDQVSTVLLGVDILIEGTRPCLQV